MQMKNRKANDLCVGTEIAVGAMLVVIPQAGVQYERNRSATDNLAAGEREVLTKLDAVDGVPPDIRATYKKVMGATYRAVGAMLTSTVWSLSRLVRKASFQVGQSYHRKAAVQVAKSSHYVLYLYSLLGI
jgi:hypothetical protein